MSKRVRVLGGLVLLQLLHLVGVAGVSAAPLAYVVGDLATSGPTTIVQRDSLFLVDLATGEAITIGQVQSVGCASVHQP